MQQLKITKAKKALKVWLEHEKICPSDFARKLNVPVLSCYRWLNKEVIPNLQMAIKIEEVTKGHVPCMLWKQESLIKKQSVKKDANAPKSPKSQETHKHSKTTPKGKR